MGKRTADPEIDKQKILDHVAKQLKLKVSSALRGPAENFAKAFYANVSLDDLTENSLESLVSSVFTMWEFCFNRMLGQTKTRVYSETMEGKDHPVSMMIVKVATDDMPFIVDSITGVINTLGYATHLVIHPVIKIERDKAGNLKEIFPPSYTGSNGQYESLVHCEIIGSFSLEKSIALETEVNRALQDTRAAVEDWEEMRRSLSAAIENLKTNPPLIPKNELEETLAFLKWVEDNHFTFLGCCEYSLVPGQKTIKQALLSQNGLGILRDPIRQEITQIFEGVELSPLTRRYVNEPDPLLIVKTSKVSLVHRPDPMDSITIKRLDQKGNVIGFYEFIGLFTSVAYNKSIFGIPLLRLKVANILKRSGFSEKRHDGKALIHILESFPRDEFFQASEDWLFETCMGVLQLQNRQRLTLFIREDRFERFFTCLVYVPRERYDSALRRRISEILENSLQGKVTNWQTQFGELAFARVYLTLKRLQKGNLHYHLKTIEEKLTEASLTWRDHLQQTLFDKFGEEKSLQLFELYGNGFSKAYQERVTPEEALIDIHEIEQTLRHSTLRSSLNYKNSKDKQHIKFKIYTLKGPIFLSNALPVLENMNFKVLTEIPFVITLSNKQKVWIHDFEMITREEEPIELDYFRDYFLEAFNLIWHEEIENDGFNRLIVRANFQWHECQLLRTYAKYLRQLQVTFSQMYMEESLAKYPLICRLMINLFACKFDPDGKEDRKSAQEEILNKIKNLLENVIVLDEDRILTKFVNAIISTLRTNYYQLKNGKKKSYISIKMDCTSIEEMPLPRPKYEIFIYSPRVEAIHLRGGQIARGGIRWSDRKEDFRTEILGLMKAQMVKNAVIIPVGSKGGFIVKHPPAREDAKGSLKDEVISCYKTMMRGLLDLTDNIKGDKILHPKNVVCWDADDTYLVVAADKGTATFSDIANQVAKEYDFWLDDAFASGGSSGYDHKKMGITARGAWESVKRHFREIGVDANKVEITVTGIGDMSGDVFGNGMLLSQHFKLVAAFNHLHIFIDPFPDPAISYQERKRLFELPHSSWIDYNPALISQGGGVFDRKAKTIAITPEMQALFEIQQENLTPTELLRYILKAPVDLIWFGGIGTFIKASTESNSDVGDHTNDSIRINGGEVRARIVAEGANLGVTQRGRIEYAKNGGRINTDAIDNSAGVDCSDHEVNLKILLGQAMKEHKLTLNERNQVLKKMTNEIAELVLKDNFWQNQAISISHSQGYRLLDEQSRLMRELEGEGLLNRALEALPDDKEIARRMADKESLTRPELAVLLAYAKISLNHQLLQSELPDMKILESRLLSYFPEELRQPYKNEVLKHPLRREITVTLFTSSIINRMGVTFVHEMKRDLGVNAVDVAKAYFIVRDLLDLISLWRDLEMIDTLPSVFQTNLMLTIYENVKQMTVWFVKFDWGNRDVQEIIDFFKSDFLYLRDNLPLFFSSNLSKSYNENYKNYKHSGLSDFLTKTLLTLNSIISIPDIILIGKELELDVKIVAKVYFALGQQLGFDWLRKAALNLSGETYWQQGAANSLVDDFYISQKALTKKVLTYSKSLDALFIGDGTITKDALYTAGIESLLIEAMNAVTIDFAMMTVINQRLRLLAYGS